MKNKTIQQLLVDSTPRMAMNSQHFANGGSSKQDEGDDDNPDDGAADDDSDDNDGDNSDDDSDDSKGNDGKDSKKFTQEDMNKRATAEK